MRPVVLPDEDLNLQGRVAGPGVIVGADDEILIAGLHQH